MSMHLRIETNRFNERHVHATLSFLAESRRCPFIDLYYFSF